MLTAICLTGYIPAHLLAYLHIICCCLSVSSSYSHNLHIIYKDPLPVEVLKANVMKHDSNVHCFCSRFKDFGLKKKRFEVMAEKKILRFFLNDCTY
jgi:hypothetical protein